MICNTATPVGDDIGATVRAVGGDAGTGAGAAEVAGVAEITRITPAPVPAFVGVDIMITSM